MAPPKLIILQSAVQITQTTQSENALTTFYTSANIIYCINSTLCEKIYTNKAAPQKMQPLPPHVYWGPLRQGNLAAFTASFVLLR